VADDVAKGGTTTVARRFALKSDFKISIRGAEDFNRPFEGSKPDRSSRTTM